MIGKGRARGLGTSNTAEPQGKGLPRARDRHRKKSDEVEEGVRKRSGRSGRQRRTYSSHGLARRALACSRTFHVAGPESVQTSTLSHTHPPTISCIGSHGERESIAPKEGDGQSDGVCLPAGRLVTARTRVPEFGAQCDETHMVRYTRVPDSSRGSTRVPPRKM